MIKNAFSWYFAHPDDESLGFGGTIAKYASEGVEVF
jgi:LmbE family N-acetylglucosaminyl deacetylase